MGSCCNCVSWRVSPGDGWNPVRLMYLGRRHCHRDGRRGGRFGPSGCSHSVLILSPGALGFALLQHFHRVTLSVVVWNSPCKKGASWHSPQGQTGDWPAAARAVAVSEARGGYKQ